MGASATIEREEVLGDLCDLRVGMVPARATVAVIEAAASGAHRELNGTDVGGRHVVEVLKCCQQSLGFEGGPGDELVENLGVKGVKLGESLQRRRVWPADEPGLEAADGAPGEAGRLPNLLWAPADQGTRFGENLS